MDFAEAMKLLREGRMIRRASWGPSTWMGVSGHSLVQCTVEGTPYEYQLSWYEIEATDWEAA